MPGVVYTLNASLALVRFVSCRNTGVGHFSPFALRSLLLGVRQQYSENTSQPDPEAEKWSCVVRSASAQSQVYYLGIIDLLRVFDTGKASGLLPPAFFCCDLGLLRRAMEQVTGVAGRSGGIDRCEMR